jgi:hypothetical protein
MPPAHKISRAFKRVSLSVWDALTTCCGMSECIDEPLLGPKISRGRSYTQPRRYNAKRRSYLRDNTSSPSPTRATINPFDDDALNPRAPSSWSRHEKSAPTTQDSAGELPLSTPFSKFNAKPFETDEQHTSPLF